MPLIKFVKTEITMKSILDYETVSLIDEDDALEIIDQTLLPGKIEIIRLHTAKEIWDAIYLLQVRGAPAIGVSAGMGLYLLMKHSKAASYDEFMKELDEKSDYLNSSRPTAVNLSWALKRMKAHVEKVPLLIPLISASSLRYEPISYRPPIPSVPPLFRMPDP